AETLTRLINAAFSIEKFFVPGDRINVSQVHEFFSKGQFLITGDDPPTGCVYVEQRADRAYFGLLSIDPSRQKTGAGRQMVEAAENWARERGCRAMDLRIVNLREELPAFYRRFGYVEGPTEPWPSEVPVSQPCHFVTMSKVL